MDLKFASLFFERIIVLDGYFHAYGPLYTHIKHTLRATPIVNAEDDPIALLLRHGVIVPAVRKGESLHHTFVNAEAGVRPGEYLCIVREDEDVLHFVDQHASHLCKWPEHMAQGISTRLGELAYRMLGAPDSPYSLQGQLKDETIPFADSAERRKVHSLLHDFEDLVVTNRDHPDFRRGKVEVLIAKHVGIELKSYQTFLDRGLCSSAVTIDTAAVDLLEVFTTIQEAHYARAFNTVGGLFPEHDRQLVVEAGLYDKFLHLPERERSVANLPLAWGSFDASALSFKDIIEIREDEKGPFGKYCELLRGLQVVPDGSSFLDANPEYVHHVVYEYLPYIVARFPQVGQLVWKVRGALVPIVYLAERGAAEVLRVGNQPIITAIFEVIGQTVAGRITNYLKRRFTKQYQREFESNNYWAEGPSQSSGGGPGKGRGDPGQAYS